MKRRTYDSRISNRATTTKKRRVDHFTALTIHLQKTRGHYRGTSSQARLARRAKTAGDIYLWAHTCHKKDVKHPHLRDNLGVVLLVYDFIHTRVLPDVLETEPGLENLRSRKTSFGKGVGGTR